MKRIITFSVFFFVLIVALFSVASFFSNKNEIKKEKQEKSEIFLPKFFQKSSREYKLIFVGDMMLSRKIGELINLSDDPEYPFTKVKEELFGADLAFANLESPISDKGVNVGSIYSFRADPKTKFLLKYSGIDIVSLANNHIFDYTKEAALDTKKHLDSVEVKSIGLGENCDTAYQPEIIKLDDGTVLGFLAGTNLLPQSVSQDGAEPCVPNFKNQRFLDSIKEIAGTIDILIVSVHWGEEYKTEHNSDQEFYAKKFIELGVDLVIGHHPHVVEEVERVGDGYVAYSLGNFIFDQNFSPETSFGLELLVKIKDKKIESVESRKVYFGKKYLPHFDSEVK